jgi:hypothetical protein
MPLDVRGVAAADQAARSRSFSRLPVSANCGAHFCTQVTITQQLAAMMAMTNAQL